MSRLVRILNFVAGLALAAFALKTASVAPALLLLPGPPIGAIAVLCIWASAAAWAAVVLIARAG